jgi:hypothetical protein
LQVLGDDSEAEERELLYVEGDLDEDGIEALVEPDHGEVIGHDNRVT